MLPDLLRAAADEPACAATRLVIADWLEEHGEAERAEFVRVQCALARLAPHDPARVALAARERALLRRHEKAWLGGLRPKRWRFRLGLLDEVTLTAERFLLHAEELFRFGPVRVVELHSAAGRSAALAAGPHLSSVDTLVLAYNFLNDTAASDLANSPHLAGVRELRLAHNFIRLAGAQALAASPHLTTLRLLDLTGNSLGGDAGRQALRDRFGERVLL